MKFLHLGDLHIGKRIYEENLMEFQQDLLCQVLEMAKEYSVDGVILAGDLYDRSIAPEPAVNMLNDFITALCDMGGKVFAIGGNHDSAGRLSFGTKLMEPAGLYLAGLTEPKLKRIIMEKDGERVAVTLMPYCKPALLEEVLKAPISDMEEGVKKLLEQNPPEKDCVNLLTAHLFVTGSENSLPERCDSEQVPVGGLEQVNFTVFDGYDYVALGHLHRPQWVGRKTVQYSGSLMKYSFSEVSHGKSAVLITTEKNGAIHTERLPLRPKRDMRMITGCLEDILAQGKASGEPTEDYLKIRLTDKELIYDAMGKVRTVYPNVLELEQTHQTMHDNNWTSVEQIRERKIWELMDDFYRMQTGESLSEGQREILVKMTENDVEK